MNQSHYYNLLFSNLNLITRNQYRKLLKKYKTAKQAWENLTPAVFNIIGIHQSKYQKIQALKEKIPINDIIQKLKKLNIDFITPDDQEFPTTLIKIPDPPLYLYKKGNIAQKDQLAIAIVGTRNMSPYGKNAAEYFASALSKLGFTIVSGMAIGIDAVAHNAAINLNNRTIAVFGQSLEQIGPRTNYFLAQKIINKNIGAWISEYPPFIQHNKFNFPERNRLISGLALGTIIIEAKEKSGALITAKAALEQGKEVFAVPGSIFTENSIGPNILIQNGAILIRSVQDILNTFNLSVNNQLADNSYKPKNRIEQTILDSLGKELYFEEIQILTKLDVETLNIHLTNLELEGIIQKTACKWNRIL